MKKYIAGAFFLLYGAFLISCSEKQQITERKQPNILFIAVDDLRPELNFYGADQIQSPHLDRLASQSLVFDRAYCNVPVCGASRASLLTGARPTRYRFIDYKTWKDADYPEAESLPMRFKNNGYSTVSNGKVYHHANDDSLAWDEIWQPSGKYSYATEAYREIRASTYRGMPLENADVPDSAYRDGKLALKAMRDLNKLKDGNKPFFLALGFYKPHLPFTAPKKYWDQYRREDIELPENYRQPETTPRKAYHNFGELRNYETIPKEGDLPEAQAKELIHGYYACVSYTDAQIGLVLNELERLGLAENTIVVLWGDHGWNLGDHKLWCKHANFNSSLRVPLLIKVPGKTNGEHTDFITETIDLYPSLCELAGIEKPVHLEGDSFVSLMETGKREKDHAVVKFHDGVTLISGSFQYTEWTDDRGLAYERMLFDQASDPLQLDNLAEKEGYQTKVAELSRELREKWGGGLPYENGTAMTGLRTYLILLLVCLEGSLQAQHRERPFIWVRAEDRPAILEKIENQSWANEIFTEFIDQLDRDIRVHETNPAAFLGELPFDWDKGTADQIPPFHLTYHIEDGKHKNLDNATEAEMAHARTLIRYLQMGIDCGIAYFITEEEKYGQCAADILYTFVTAVRQSPVSEWRGRGGWLFPDDGFREVREIGYKVPLIYDFVADFIEKGGRPYDLAKERKTDFPISKAQEVFRTYADLTIHYGQTGSNHPILEAPNLVYNALAMEDEPERDCLLAYFLTENTENQDALSEMAKIYKEKGDLWPETSQYLNAAASILTRLMLVVNRYDPAKKLGERYAPILYSLPALDYLVYPNGQLIRWGDGKRTGTPPYSSYEEAYLLGTMDGEEKITREFASLLASAMQQGAYQRSGMLAVLWHEQDYGGEGEELVLPRTDKVDHAGIFLQRNESETGNPEDGLMAFVGGAHMVHGHAEGMNIELYGKGEVLGVDNGRGRYQQDIHENYSRLFAAHNTVIVNGNSQSEGGWVNLGINTVTQVAMEPQPRERAISPDHSFSITRFVDDKGDLAEAIQERTLALIRTSDTSGYYVDVFRTRSELPQQYHDYLYHNIGDSLLFLNEDLELTPTPHRYTANADLPWIQNRQYRHPGWHFFEEVLTAENYQKGVRARFFAGNFDQPIYMEVHIPPQNDRAYTKVLAPPTFEAPDPYEKQPTPTLLIRQYGEAWHQPFALVFEPFGGTNATPTVQAVEKLTQDGNFMGLRVLSRVADRELVQYILLPTPGKVFSDQNLGISFTGSFAVITTEIGDKLQSIYIGEGEELRYGAIGVRTPVDKKSVYRKF